MNYQCWPEWNGGNFDATRATTFAPSSTSSPSPPTSSALASIPANTEPQHESKSQAWIAGPVVGGVLGAGLFGLLGWWLHKRQHKRKQAVYENLPVEMYAGKKTRYGHHGESDIVEVEGGGVNEIGGEEIPVEIDGSQVGNTLLQSLQQQLQNAASKFKQRKFNKESTLRLLSGTPPQHKMVWNRNRIENWVRSKPKFEER